MGGTVAALWTRVLGLFGKMSMYRLTLAALAALTAIALVLSALDLVAPSPLELIVAVLVLSASCAAVDAVVQRLLHLPSRVESGLITALILVFVLRPTLDPWGVLGLALAGVAASGSKYVVAWRGRHIFNPAAVGATVLTLLSLAAPALGASAWWVGSPAMVGPVVVLGLAVLVRTEKVRVVAVFWLVALAVAFVRVGVQYADAGLAVDPALMLSAVVWSSPAFFLGAFMLSEPLTQPPRRWQQFVVAGVVGILVGWPLDLGVVSLGQERALLVGNLVAFAFTVRTAVRVVLQSREDLTPSIRRLTFRATRGLRFLPGQYLELDVPHRRPDARGTRREFSIVSAPSDLPTVQIAFRADAAGAPVSSYKRALAEVPTGAALAVTGIWGDFVMPRRDSAPVLLVAAGIGVTPFVSQLREDRQTGVERDVVLVYVASTAAELAFRPELEATGVPVIVFTRDEPTGLPANWHWAGGARLDAERLALAVADLPARHAFVSGPPSLVAELTPALSRARSLTTDAFAGY